MKCEDLKERNTCNAVFQLITHNVHTFRLRRPIKMYLRKRGPGYSVNLNQLMGRMYLL
jgi:hypothetical protein